MTSNYGQFSQKPKFHMFTVVTVDKSRIFKQICTETVRIHEFMSRKYSAKKKVIQIHSSTVMADRTKFGF